MIDPLEELDDGDIPEFVTVIRGKDGIVKIDHSGLAADTVTALLAQAFFWWLSPDSEEDDEV